MRRRRPAFVFISFFLMPIAAALQAEWIQAATDDLTRIQPRRSGHTAFFDGGKDHFVFGGYIENDDMTRSVTNDLWQWKQNGGGGGGGYQLVQPTGDIPRERLVAACAVLGGNAYLFGGWDPGTQGTGGDILDTVHRLDLKTLQWTQLLTTFPDGPTSRLVAVAISDDSIVLHNHRCTDFVYLFDGKETFSKQSTTGPCPSPRGLHAACRLGHTIVFFGGAAQSGTMSNQVHLLDTNTWEYTLLEQQQEPCWPCPRAAPCLVPYENDSCALLFGGAAAAAATQPPDGGGGLGGLIPQGDVWAFHLQQQRFELLLDEKSSDGGPSPRNAATLMPINNNNNEFLLTGGWNPFQKTFDDSYILRVTDDDD